MKKLMLTLGTLALLFTLGCGKDKKCLEGCEQGLKTAKEACESQKEGPGAEACKETIKTAEKAVEECKKACP